MSQTEFHFGKLRKVDLQGLSLEEYCEIKCNERGITELTKYSNTWVQKFRDEFFYNIKTYKAEFFIYQEDLYEIFDHQEEQDDFCFMKLIPNSDGTLTFCSMFYNGGTCLDEMLEEAFKEKNKNE